MQDRPQRPASNDNVEEHDEKKSFENPSELTEEFPHLFSPAGRDTSERDRRACRVPKQVG